MVSADASSSAAARWALPRLDQTGDPRRLGAGDDADDATEVHTALRADFPRRAVTYQAVKASLSHEVNKAVAQIERSERGSYRARSEARSTDLPSNPAATR